MRVQVLYWQDIPSVVRVGDAKRQLPEWFQQEIDRVAMEQGLLGSDAYLEQWEWRDFGERDGDPSVAADEVEAELVARYPGSQPS
jgi:cvfA/B/C family virulence factor